MNINLYPEFTFFMRLIVTNATGEAFFVVQDLGGFSQKFVIRDLQLFIYNGNAEVLVTALPFNVFTNIIIRKQIYQSGAATETHIFLTYLDGVAQTSVVSLIQVNNNQTNIRIVENINHQFGAKIMGFVRQDISATEVASLNTAMGSL